jgi:hypothetical protein
VLFRSRQKDHFEQLWLTTQKWFAATGRRRPEFQHVTFGTILGEDGKAIKTRSGDPIKLAALLAEADQLDAFRRGSDNLYHRVRALLFLHSIHRFHLPRLLASEKPGAIPFKGYENLLERRFEEAIDLRCNSPALRNRPHNQGRPAAGISSDKEAGHLGVIGRRAG